MAASGSHPWLSLTAAASWGPLSKLDGTARGEGEKRARLENRCTGLAAAFEARRPVTRGLTPSRATSDPGLRLRIGRRHPNPSDTSGNQSQRRCPPEKSVRKLFTAAFQRIRAVFEDTRTGLLDFLCFVIDQKGNLMTSKSSGILYLILLNNRRDVRLSLNDELEELAFRINQLENENYITKGN